MDVIDANAEDVRFLQATRHGEVMTPVELVEDTRRDLEGRADAGHRAAAQRRVARSRAGPRRCARSERAGCCSGTTSATNSPTVSTATICTTPAGRYEQAFMRRAGRRRSAGDDGARSAGARRRSARSRSCRSSRCSIVHGVYNEVPLFLASFAGFVAALPAIVAHPEDARAWRCAKRCSSTPSTTSCFRCSCRSRC